MNCCMVSSYYLLSTFEYRLFHLKGKVFESYSLTYQYFFMQVWLIIIVVIILRTS